MSLDLRTAAVLVLAGVLNACGGGGGIGSGGTGLQVGLADGSVSGFGSIVVDGTAYATTNDLADVETAPGQLTRRAARFGESVRVEFDVREGVERAASVRLEPMAVGPAAGIDARNGTLQVAGQPVVVNADAALGPVTFLDGFGSLVTLAEGRWLEVHAQPRWNAALGRYELWATRLSMLGEGGGTWRAGGVVESVGVGRFRLGLIDVVPPTAAALPRAGDRVVVWAAAAPSNGVLTATGLRIVPVADDSTTPLRLGGLVSRLDAASARFEVGGRAVRFGGAVVTPNPNSGTVLAEGQPVQVEGVLAADGAVEASRVKIRKRGAQDVVEAELSGPVQSYAGLASFAVRGTPVDASQLIRPLQGCGNRGLEGRTVRVEGRVAGTAAGSVIQADILRCLD